MDKRKAEAMKVCRYGSNCFRVNPVHLKEFAHPHLEAILAEGKKADGTYSIPESYSCDKVKEQLEIIKSIQAPQPPLKIPKIEEEPKAEQKVFSIFSPPSDKFIKKSPEQPKSSMKPSTSSSSQFSSLQKELDEKDFFKQRAAAFRAKNPESMRAPSPPPRDQPSTSQRNSNPANSQQLDALMYKLLPVVVPKGRMAEKLKKAAPYNVFLTTVTAAPETHNDPLSITFQEILDPSLGDLESSVQFNFMIEIGWLLDQYTFAKCSQQPLLIFYGQDLPGLSDINSKRPNVTAIKVKIPTPIGCHHTKMMLLFYKDNSMRVVVSTANLYEDDWDNRVQGMWISDCLPALAEGVSHTEQGESVTNFRRDLMGYLIAYDLPKLQPIVARIRSTDFSAVNVFFVSSVPGSHRNAGNGIHYGHPRIGTLLSEHSAPIDDSCPIIFQSSSIGNLGTSVGAYLQGEVTASFRKDTAENGLRRLPNVKLVYPSLQNVLSSHDGMAGGGCLPYTGQAHDKQRWLNEYLYQWKAASRNRTRAMPHIKSYCRFSDRGLYWFILTSANISKSAWGSLNKSKNNLNPTLRINSYEAGVVFFPRVILGKDRFPMTEAQQRDNEPIFKLPFDTTFVRFGKDDVPYCAEYLKAYLAKYGAL